MKNPAKTFAQIGLPERAPGRFGRVFGIGKAGSGLDTVDAGGSPRDRAALTSARSRTSPHAVVSVDVSLFQFIGKLLGVCARTVLPRSRHTAANDDAVRVLAPVDTVREVRESSRRAVVHARLLGASPPTRLFKSKQKRVRKGDDTGSRWIQTLSYNSRNGGTLLTLFADCQLVSRIFSPRCLCVARCFGKNLGRPFACVGALGSLQRTRATSPSSLVARPRPCAG